MINTDQNPNPVVSKCNETTVSPLHPSMILELSKAEQTASRIYLLYHVP